MPLAFNNMKKGPLCYSWTKKAQTVQSNESHGHICHKLWTNICEIGNILREIKQNCEIFLNNTLELLKYSLKSFFFM